jgi:LmbE family N-acetylglucosaminyl deacetylase
VDSATPVADAGPSGPVDLDVLFIGAHPDDEAGGLSTYGQWNEVNDAEVGVITITRGEGGGNAVGTEEGPALGLLREDEERRAVGLAGIEHIYNLDKVDFYYTVSAPLTEETWGYDDTLERVVRIIRTTRPEVITTMNPSPTPGNHGHHQVAARLAVDAFYSAADETAFPDQLADEGLSTWDVSKIFRAGGAGEGQPGPDCASTYVPADPTDIVYGVWAGNTSDANGGRTWAEIEREAQRTYASQGWAAFPDAETDPAEITCDYFTLIDSRVPLSTNPESITAVLDNAVLDVPRGLPLGSQLYLTTDTFDVLAGEPFTVTSHLQVPGDVDTSEAFVQLVAPTGWEVVGAEEAEQAAAEGEEATPVVTETEDGELTQEFTIVPATDAEVNTRYTIGASVGAGGGIGVTSEVVRVVPPVSGSLAPLPQIAQFQEWAESVGVPELESLITPVAPIGLGGEQELGIDIVNNSAEEQSGTVTVALPAGFETDTPSVPFDAIPAGEASSVTFTVRNTDTTLATSNEGGEEGTYAFDITTEAAGVSSVQSAGLNLVPTTVVPQAETAPVVDGQIGTDEYTGEPLDLSRVWEGDDPDSPEDASGTGYVTWGEEGIYVAVEVTDDTLGTVLPQEDAKRHWRTDSVEIAIDPLGTAENTSATFKVGVFPTTTEGTPAAYRDADAFQGPVATTAPGFEVASTLSEPYTGYVLETLIPWDSLPADIDPQEAAMNIFIYDSDTEDLTGQTRLGWSTWNGVQGDPYRWGLTEFEGYTPPADARTEPEEPRMPLDVARSIDSPQSIAQSASDGVGLAGKPTVPEGEGVQVLDDPVIENGQVTLQVETTMEGTMNLFYEADGAIVSNASQTVSPGAPISVQLATDGSTAGTVYLAFESTEDEVQALAIPVTGQ